MNSSGGSFDYSRVPDEGICVFTTSSGFVGEGKSMSAAIEAARAKENAQREVNLAVAGWAYRDARCHQPN